jgi:hypothetical protein
MKLAAIGVMSIGLATLSAQTSAPEDPQAIQRMAATERAFAAAAAEIGLRDSFLTFFAPDAIALRPAPAGATAAVVQPARPGLEAGPLEKLPLGSRLMWEPFTGHVSSDGTLGWLTGGYAVVSVPPRPLARQGAYFSVWQREPDGTWRVWLDAGVQLPAVWQDAAPFRAAPDPNAGTAGEPNESLEAAEQDVARGVAAWQARLSAGVRLHRDGQMPFVGHDAAAAAAAAWPQIEWTVVKTRLAGSNDLGVTLGGYEHAPAPAAPQGIWVRVWKRDIAGRWRIVFETER